MIYEMINVEVRVISRAEGESDNSYQDIDNFAYHKTESDNCFIIHCKSFFLEQLTNSPSEELKKQDAIT